MTREESLNLAKYEETPYYFQRLINKIYDEFDLELEELENRSCWDCKYSEKTSGGVYCMCFLMYPDFEYCSEWKLKK